MQQPQQSSSGPWVVAEVTCDNNNKPCLKSKKRKRKDKYKEGGKTAQSQQEKQPPAASQAQPQAPDKASYLAIMSLVTKGPGMRISHLQSWSEKAAKLTDKINGIS